jgi:hypothetical protein
MRQLVEGFNLDKNKEDHVNNELVLLVLKIGLSYLDHSCQSSFKFSMALA